MFVGNSISFEGNCLLSFRLQEWKQGTGGIGRCLPKFQREPETENNENADLQPPELLLCEIKSDELQVPANIRQQYLGDPIRAPEWKQILSEFDRKWARGDQGGDAEQASSLVVSDEAPSGNQDEQFSWQTIFPEEPSTKSDMESKYGTPAASFAINETLSAFLCEGPRLFLVACGEGEFGTTEPIICFGAGVWLLEAKADSFLQDHGLVLWLEV